MCKTVENAKPLEKTLGKDNLGVSLGSCAPLKNTKRS